MALSITVLHVPAFFIRTQYLARQIERFGGRDGLDTRVLSYSVVEDFPGRTPARERNLWPAARRQWMAVHPDATHVLLLQDDMLPAFGFLDAVQQMMTSVPDAFIGLFTTRTDQEWALSKGQHWWTNRTGIWGGAVLLPAAMLADMLRWCDQHVDPEYRWDDGRMGFYTWANRIPIWFTAPSLVEHLGAAISLVGNDNRKRVANVFWDDVRGVDFSRPADDDLLVINGNGYDPWLNKWLSDEVVPLMANWQ